MASNTHIKLLLPHKYRILSPVLLFLGLISAYFRFYLGIKPDFLDLPVFAVHSRILATKSFTMIQNNLFEEIVILFFLAGFYLLPLTKEKQEKEHYTSMRTGSFLLTIWMLLLVNIVALFVFFGFSYLFFLFFNLFLFPFTYFCIFRIKIAKKT